MNPSDLPDMEFARKVARERGHAYPEGKRLADGVTPLSREQAAVVSIYTGYLVGNFADVQQLAEHLMGGPVWTHEMPALWDKFRELSKPLFLRLVPDGEPR